MTVLLERRLPVALLPLRSLLLFLLGLRGQHKLLRYLLLRDELRDGTRLPDPEGGKGGWRETGGADTEVGGNWERTEWQINERENHGEHTASCERVAIIKSQ